MGMMSDTWAACALLFVAQWPVHARAAFYDPAMPLEARLGGALLASPALWLGSRLIAAPHAGLMPKDGAISLFPVRQMQQTTLSH